MIGKNIRKLTRLICGKSEREKIVVQAKQERQYASARNLGLLEAKTNYLERLVEQFKEDTRR